MPSNPVALVTGAGSGIGRAVCELLAGAGHRLALVGRNESRLQETMEAIGARTAAPPDTLLVAADLADAGQACSAVDMALQQWGRVDALINNAGVAALAPIEDTDEDALYRTFSVNVFGAAHLIARLWPVFRKQRSGCVVNISSMAAADPFPGFFVYASTKSAIESLTRSAAKEGGDFGVRAFSVAPGAVETGMLRRHFTERDIPRAQTLDPIDVAHIVCDCVLGRRDAEMGATIAVPSP